MVVFSLLLATACSNAGGTGSDSGPADGAVEAPVEAGPIADAAGWATIEERLRVRAAEAEVSTFGLTIWDARDQRVFESLSGGFTPGTRVAIASASKLVATLVIFEVIRRGQLSLDSTTEQVLGWSAPKGSITLRHLLSFTSGLPREAGCIANPLVTLEACVKTIESATPVALPGTRFDYGSTHLHVAARMAEVVTGRSWPQLFEDILRKPLALPEEVAFFTFPRQAIGRINPLIAGGMRASVNDYQGFLALAFHQGTFGTAAVGTPALFEAQTREPFPQVTIGYTPFPEARYGLGSWLLCDSPASGCPLVTSPGAFGFTPWLDRGAGYYAILGMELTGTSTDDRPAEFAVKVLTELQPLIRAQLGR